MGIATTVAIAWGCALADPHLNDTWNWSHQYGLKDTWSYWMGEAFGTVKVMRASSRFDVQSGLVAEDKTSRRGHEPPQWSSVHTPPLEHQLNAHGTWMEDARGWPFICMMSRYSTVDGERRRTCGIQVTGTPKFVTLPLLPIASGIFANATMYSAIWFCVIAGPSVAQRAIRTKRGRCTNCGYDRRYSISARCSECGSA